jgi:hypothetical protein
MHPLVHDFDTLKDSELESRVQDLTKKYYMTQNTDLRQQISMTLDVYQNELQIRRAKAWQQQYQKRDTDLDSLINVR